MRQELCHAVFPDLEVDAWDASLWQAAADAGRWDAEPTSPPGASDEPAGAGSAPAADAAGAAHAETAGLSSRSSRKHSGGRGAAASLPPDAWSSSSGRSGAASRRLSPLTPLPGWRAELGGRAHGSAASRAELAAIQRSQAQQGEALRVLLATQQRLSAQIDAMALRHEAQQAGGAAALLATAEEASDPPDDAPHPPPLPSDAAAVAPAGAADAPPPLPPTTTHAPPTMPPPAAEQGWAGEPEESVSGVDDGLCGRDDVCLLPRAGSSGAGGGGGACGRASSGLCHAAVQLVKASSHGALRKQGSHASSSSSMRKHSTIETIHAE